MRTPLLGLVVTTLLVHHCAAYFEEFEFENLSHDRIEPEIKRSGRDSSKVVLCFTAYGREFEVHLIENQVIFTQDFHVIIDDDLGGKRGPSFEREAKEMDHECKYYFSDDATLSATMSICFSNQVSGLLSANGSTFLIRYGHEAGRTAEHSIFHYEEIPCPTGRCLDTGPIKKLKDFLKQRTMIITPVVQSTNPPVTSKYVELGLVYDKATLAYIHSIRGENVTTFTAKLVHAISSAYSKLNIRIVVKNLILWTKVDKIAMYNDIEDTLMTFADYNVEKFDRKSSRDVTLLISGHRFTHSPGILGVAFKSQTCENCELAVAVVTVASDFDVTHVAGVASHELGHCLGFDDEFYGKQSHECFGRCTDPVDQMSCIMRAVYTSASTAWSECTKDRVNDREVSHAYECLYNQPNISAHPICRNGVIEQGEECDCMPSDSDCSLCCDMTTCKLREGAECSSELCCQTGGQASCRIDHSSKVCRPVVDPQCDLEDTCDGISAVCFDHHKPDKTDCGPLKWCMSGRCADKCIKNCFDAGDCVQMGEEWECSCHSLHYGRHCQNRFSIAFLLSASLISFVAAFTTTLLSLFVVRLWCKK